MRTDGPEYGEAAPPLFDWRQIAVDQRIDSLPEHLREQSAVTAQSIAATFKFGARVRERMAACRPDARDRLRSRAAWNRTVAEFERSQAEALRAGRLLVTPWRPVPARAQAPTGWAGGGSHGRRRP